MYKSFFTVEQGITIQTRNLDEWAKVLKPEIYKSLVIHATEKNNEAKDGYFICRGDGIDIMVRRMASGQLEILS